MPSIAEDFADLAARAAYFDEQFDHLDPDDRLGTRTADLVWSYLAAPARRISTWVIETRAIPRGKAKAVELAVRAFGIKKPRNVVAWWQKNRRHVETLLEAQNWPDRTAEGLDVYEVGPLVVHDTLHMSDAELSRTLEVIERVIEALADDPGLSDVLYGPVYVVGRLRVPRVLAWYYPKDDVIYLRPQRGDFERETFNLLHELGHRFWRQFLTPEERKPWITRHTELSYASVDVPSPQPGDLIPVHGREDPVEILDIRMIPGLRDPQVIVEDGRIPYASIVRKREQRARAELFPTAYSMQDVEEHFAEAFAMRALGILPEEHEAFFEDWFEDVRPRSPNALKAALLSTMTR